MPKPKGAALTHQRQRKVAAAGPSQGDIDTAVEQFQRELESPELAAAIADPFPLIEETTSPEQLPTVQEWLAAGSPMTEVDPATGKRLSESIMEEAAALERSATFDPSGEHGYFPEAEPSPAEAAAADADIELGQEGADKSGISFHRAHRAGEDVLTIEKSGVELGYAGRAGALWQTYLPGGDQFDGSFRRLDDLKAFIRREWQHVHPQRPSRGGKAATKPAVARPAKAATSANTARSSAQPAIPPEGRSLPVGTVLTATFKGQRRTLTVIAADWGTGYQLDGIGGPFFKSTSLAAKAVAGSNRNGWTFWKVEK